MKTILAFIFLLSFCISCKKAESNNPTNSTSTGTVTIDTTYKLSNLSFEIKTFKNTNGQVVVALFNSSSNYSNNIIYKSFITPITSTEMKINFDSIPAGSYALSCIHDENSNSVLDQNVFGIPTEGYGFSNNPGITFGQPTYSQVKFTVAEKDSIKMIVDLIYF